MTTLLLGIITFFAVHSIAIATPAWRERMIGKMSLNGWKALYSVIAAVGLVLIVIGYSQARMEPTVVYIPPFWLRHVALLLLIPVFPLLLAAYLPGRIQRATKHPMLAATKLWAFAHLLANGMLADVVLFGVFLVWAVIDRISLKRRPPKATPHMPAGKWNDTIAVVGGLVLYLVFVGWAHRWLIGVSPLPMS